MEAVARIGSYSTDLVAGSWVSSRGLDAIFGIDAQYDRSVAGWVSLVHPDDRDVMVAYLTDEVVGRGQPFDRAYRIIRPDNGEERWLHGHGKLEFDATGRPIRMFGTIADVTVQRRLAIHDRKLLEAIDQTGEAILITGPTGEIEYANPAFRRMNGLAPDERMEGSATAFGHLPSPEALHEVELALATGRSWSGDGIVHRPDGTEAAVEASISPVRDPDGTMTGLVTVVRDVTAERALRVERERLAAAVEQTSDSVMIVDLAGNIEYVNPAFERASGYSRDDAVGQNPRILKSGRQSAAFYRALWRRLVGGETWNGTLVNRRKDGSLYEEEANLSPLRGPRGEITGYVAVKRDVTELRAAESDLARAFRERAEVTAALARLQPGATAEATAADMCERLLGLSNVDAAVIYTFSGRNRVKPLAVRGPAGMPQAAGRPIPSSRATYLHERAKQGPWAEDWRQRAEDGEYGQALANLGIRAVAYAPIHSRDGLIGLVAAGTRDEAFAHHMIDHLPAVGEFAATAGGLLGDQLARGRRDELMRAHVQRGLAPGGLTPAFQPIVALVTGEVVGYEALTRFADGTPPDEMIADAHSVGLGQELEVACIAAALDASAGLPPNVWLSLNASPDVILRSGELAALLAGRSRRIVLEVTEHAEIGDYPAFGRVLAGFGPNVSLAVDDAGAGFASLRHVVELRPRFLKVDISLVRQSDSDVTRQAMIAGLRHFAERVGCEVIAEGIEEPAECEILRDLGVSLGQGFLLGRPQPAPPTAGQRRAGSASVRRQRALKPAARKPAARKPRSSPPHPVPASRPRQ